MAGITTRNLDDSFEGRIVGWFLAENQACARFMEDERRRGEAPDDHPPDAILVATSSHRLAVMAPSTDEHRTSGVATVNR